MRSFNVTTEGPQGRKQTAQRVEIENLTPGVYIFPKYPARLISLDVHLLNIKNSLMQGELNNGNFSAENHKLFCEI
jgi:hypothetical protein